MIRIRQLRGEADVVVVGAGPGGAAAAARLATAGLRVVLIDQYQFPRDKVCGDFLSPVALDELADLGLPQFPGYLSTNIARSAAVFMEGKRLLERRLPSVPPLPDYGRVIPRLRLDAWIVEAALRAGARLIDGARVQGFSVTADGIRITYTRERHVESICAPIAIAADGSNSVMARVLRGGATDKSSRIVALRAYYDGVEGPADQADLYFSTESFPGYYWLFPTGGGEANVGIGVATDTIPKADLRLRELFTRMVQRDAALARRLRGAELRGKVLGWPLATYTPRAPTVADRLLFVGDAANLINPLNGEGIQTALLSARWAAETVVAATTAGSFSAADLDGYRRRVEQELRYDMALACLIVQGIRNRTLNALWMQLFRIIAARARRDEAYSHIAGGILAGVVSAGDALSWRMLRGTAEQTAWAAAAGSFRMLFRGPRGIAQAGLDSARLGFGLMYDVLNDPLGFAQWAARSGSGVMELAFGAGAHALSGRRPAPEPARLPAPRP